ncbi:hypothetical protein WOLCODRAFT_135125 [Wolfiporia cocos MD-104 SS10]|uniref:Uncharacterized protein n=1 Tax=Wolfiporia cocos (strain MD-104) TaxID=742152 RepID=A0A2H3IVG0_WOLCO|nr:hypothetical protein WOLCODRAFT_135125 [Wolfiporia cocos MD-104 SS10]
MGNGYVTVRMRNPRSEVRDCCPRQPMPRSSGLAAGSRSRCNPNLDFQVSLSIIYSHCPGHVHPDNAEIPLEFQCYARSAHKISTFRWHRTTDETRQPLCRRTRPATPCWLQCSRTVSA